MPDQHTHKNGNGNGSKEKIRKVLFNEFTFIVAIISCIFGVIMFVTKPDAQMKQDIALIKQSIGEMKTNHLKHIQDGLDKESERNDEQDKLLRQISINLTEAITLIKNND